MSSIFDICAIDAGQTRVRYLIFHAGKTMLSGQMDQGITNILLPEALNTLRNNIHSMLEQFRETFGQYRFRVVSIIILHAGTGAFAFGRDQHGKCKRTGGWGYLLGDEGAGFWLGLSGIRAALHALEQTGPYTSLKEALLRKRERSVPNIPT